MSLRVWLIGPVTAACGFLALAMGGCSSSSNGTTPADAGDDVVVRRMLDGGGIVGDDSSSAPTYDGTTGKTCTADKDCVSATGPGTNVCSSSVPGVVSGQTVQFWSSPVCIVDPRTTGCDPAPLGEAIGPHYCDGPDDPSSPGICVPFDLNNPQPGEGLCYPKCSYTLGASATGCSGSNVCELDWLFNPTSATAGVMGVGFCSSICQADKDCASLGAGYACQVDVGLCTTKTVTRSKPIGASCVVAADGGADDNTTGACNCFAGETDDGYCSSECVTGGTPCPNGYVCEDGESSSPFTGAPTQTTVTKGVAGFCVPACSLVDGGVPEAGTSTTPEASTEDGGEDAAPAPTTPEAGTSDASGTGGACPGSALCQNTTLSGPDCLP
jgi:hypothetical protein